MSTREVQERQRAMSGDVVARQAGRQAAAPLVAQISNWQQTIVRLRARIDHAVFRREATDSVGGELDELEATINRSVEVWRRSLAGEDPSGFVHDAEKAASNTLSLIAALRQRL